MQQQKQKGGANMYYAIMRCEKMKRNQCGQYDNHHWRQRDKLKERKNADKEDRNINWLKDNQTFVQHVISCRWGQ